MARFASGAAPLATRRRDNFFVRSPSVPPAFALVMAGLGLGSTFTAIIMRRVTGRYERGAGRKKAALHGIRHRWAARAFVTGGVLLGLILLPGLLRPPLIIFGLLWVLNGAGQSLIAIPSSTLLAEHTFEEQRGRAYAAHFALTHACWLITYPAVGHAAARWGSPSTFTAAGVACLLITAGALALGRGTRGAHTHERGHATSTV